MSLETLPVELLEHIIKSAVPPVTDRDTVKERYRILLNFALVSWRWTRIVQPLLLSTVDLKTWAPLSNLLTTCQSEVTWARLVKAVKLFIGIHGTIDLAALTNLSHLRTLSVWVVKVVFSGGLDKVALPTVETLSTCFSRTEWLTDLSDWRLDLRDFPASLRIVANTSAQLELPFARNEILYAVDMHELVEGINSGFFRGHFPLQDLRHLVLVNYNAYLDDMRDGLRRVSDAIARLPYLKTVFVAIRSLSSTPASQQAFSAYVKDRDITHVELNWDEQYTEGSLIPPQWLDM
ncbi:hypothetical protein JCM10296v2_007283 [Rhodotorula toruloides]